MQRSILLFACSLICCSLLAQQYPIVHYTPRDGLVNSRVRKAFQDSKGRMYFLTFGGLSVYDGARFKNYTSDNGLGSDLVNDIIEIGDDSLLIAVNLNVINLLTKGTLSVFKTKNGFCPLVNQFLKSTDGYIYATSDDGLYRLTGDLFEKIELTGPTPGYSPPPYFGPITEYKDFLLFSTNDLRSLIGLYIYDRKMKRIIDQFISKPVGFLAKDKKERIWAGLSDGGYILDPTALEKGKIKLIRPGKNYELIANRSPNAMGFDDQYSWLVNSQNEIVSFDDNGINLTLQLPNETASSIAHHIFIDKENSAWVSYDGGGVFKLTTPRIRMLKNPFNDDGSMGGIYAKSNKSATWFSSSHGNLLLKKTSAGIAAFRCNIKPLPTIVSEEGTHLLAYDGRHIYESYDGNSPSIHFKTVITLSDSDRFGKYVLLDPFKNILATTVGGLRVWKNNQPLFQNPMSGVDLVEGLSFDKGGMMWITPRYSEIIGFSLHPETPSQYLQEISRFKIAPISPRSMVIDKKDRMWVGSRNDGIVVYQIMGKQLKKIAHFKTSNGLTDNFVTSLECDVDGNIIAGTQTGLDRIIPGDDNQFRIENLTKSSNVYAYIHQVWTEQDSKVYALTNMGSVIAILPAPKQSANYRPVPIIEELKLNGRPVSSLKTVFHYDQNNLSFLVAAPSFIDEKQIKFSWLLEGSSNTTWSDTSSANSAINLTNVAAGKYTLRIKAFFLSTFYTPEELTYAFEIKSPWWQTWWFRSLMGLFILGFLLLTARFYYRRKLQKQLIVLERRQAIEKERSRIASDMHDDLGAGLSTIRFLSEKVKRNSFSDVTKNDAEKIVVNSNELVQKMNEIIWAMNEKNDTLEDLLFYTRSYAVEYCEENDLRCEVHLPETIPSLFVSGEIRRNVFLTVKESLHNVVKHAKAGKVVLDFHITRSLEVSIRDDGAGLSNRSETSGNGLRNMQKRIESLHGTFEVIDAQGVMVRIAVPLP